jgi:drug/metabolite transporter (DMT)-like permease
VRFSIPLLVSLLCLVWGSTWLVIKIGLRGVPPFLGAGLRFLLASGVMFALVGARRIPLRFDRGGKISVLSCGLLTFTGSYAAVYWAEQRISSGMTAVLYCLMPLFVALLSRYWTKAETLTARKAAGILIGIAGTIVLFAPALRTSRAEAAGMFVALCGAFCSSLNLVVLKKHGRHTDTYALNAAGMAIGALCLLSLSAALERGQSVVWTTANASALVYLALAGTVATFMVYFHLLKTTEATKLSLISLVIPVVAVVLGAVFLDEPVSGVSAAGMAIVLAGVATTLTRRA